MNRKLVAALVLCAQLVGASTSVTRADKIPDRLGERVPGGFAMALSFDGHYIHINVESTSKRDLQIREPWSDSIQLFYVNERGEQILLPRHYKEGDDIDEIMNNVDSSVHGPIHCPAHMSLWYSGDDLALIEKRPVLCRVSVYDPTMKQIFKLESSPKMLAPLVPGNSVFRTRTDGDTIGKFRLADGNQVIINCFSPGVNVRSEDFYISLLFPEKDDLLGVLRHIKVRGGELNKTVENWFELCGEKGWMGLSVRSVTREELRQLASAHEIVFEVENYKSLTLDENQVAQIRALLTYTDKCPEPKYNP